MFPGPGSVYPPSQQQFQIPPGAVYPPRGSLPQTIPPNFPQPVSVNKSLYPPASYPRPFQAPMQPHPSQAHHYPLQPGVLPPQPYYSEQKSTQYGGYQEFNTNYPASYPPSQPAYGAPSTNYPPPPPPPSQSSAYLTPQPSYPPYPSSSIQQRPLKMPSGGDFTVNSHDLKRQSP